MLKNTTEKFKEWIRGKDRIVVPFYDTLHAAEI